MSFVQVRCPHCDGINAIEATLCQACGKGLRDALTNQAASHVTTTARGVGWGTITLCGLSVLTGFAGVMFLSEATMGVGFVALACLLAIWARMSQAGDHKYR